MPRKYAVPGVVLIVYALLMILAGAIAYTAAPEGANAATALIIPSAAALFIIICGVLTLMAGRKPRLGRIGAHAGVMLAIVFALIFGYTAWKRTEALRNHPAVAAEYLRALDSGAVAGTTDAKRDFFRERSASPHDTTYLVRTLWFLTGLSGATFVVLIILRPKPTAAAT